MNHNDLSYGAPEPLSTEEAAELANVLPPTLEEAYAEGRKDQLEEDRAELEQTSRCLSWLLAYLDDRSDVTDRRDGTVQANAEMSALAAYEEQFGRRAA